MPSVNINEDFTDNVIIDVSDLDLKAYYSYNSKVIEFKATKVSLYLQTGVTYFYGDKGEYLGSHFYSFKREVVVDFLRKELEKKVLAAERKILKTKKLLEGLK